jgi:hypothetical protein
MRSNLDSRWQTVNAGRAEEGPAAPLLLTPEASGGAGATRFRSRRRPSRHLPPPRLVLPSSAYSSTATRPASWRQRRKGATGSRHGSTTLWRRRGRFTPLRRRSAAMLLPRAPRQQHPLGAGARRTAAGAATVTTAGRDDQRRLGGHGRASEQDHQHHFSWSLPRHRSVDCLCRPAECPAPW